MRRGGFTLVELGVAGLLFAVVLVGVQHVMHVATRGSVRAGDVEASLRAMAIGLEVIGRDVRLFAPKKLARDLSIARDGRSFSMRVASRIEGDLWNMDVEVVSYALRALPGDRQQLVRRDRSGERAVGSCVVQDMRVVYVPGKRGFLQVTLIGPPAGDRPLVASELLPVRAVELPGSFPIPEVSS